MDDDLFDSVRQAREWFTKGMLSIEAYDAILTEYEHHLDREQHTFSQADLSPFHPDMRRDR
jgi:hypothetical protein